jgi:hypothetical protein
VERLRPCTKGLLNRCVDVVQERTYPQTRFVGAVRVTYEKMARFEEGA